MRAPGRAVWSHSLRLRSRILSPRMFGDPELGRLHPLVRWFALGLCTAADRDGRLVGETTMLGAVFLPFDRQAEAEGMLRHLERVGLITRYTAMVTGMETPVVQILEPLWKYQPPSAREMRSKLPGLPVATPPPDERGGIIPAAVLEAFQRAHPDEVRSVIISEESVREMAAAGRPLTADEAPAYAAILAELAEPMEPEAVRLTITNGVVAPHPSTPRSWLDFDAPFWAKEAGARIAQGEKSEYVTRIGPLLLDWQGGKDVNP